ncbi:hypothetical protein BDW22DRAFT_180461 [Trametopsis cervina]|nr:hypothetical protein BDW22DRAFT_180461 [Trametopsis cervina]
METQLLETLVYTDNFLSRYEIGSRRQKKISRRLLLQYASKHEAQWPQQSVKISEKRGARKDDCDTACMIPSYSHVSFIPYFHSFGSPSREEPGRTCCPRKTVGGSSRTYGCAPQGDLIRLISPSCTGTLPPKIWSGRRRVPPFATSKHATDATNTYVRL